MSILDRKVSVEFTTRTIAKSTFLVILLLALISMIRELSGVITLVITAFFLSLALNPAVRLISRMLPSRSRKLATGFAFFVVVSFLVLFFSVTVPPIARQVTEFARDLPELVADFKSQDNAINDFIDRFDIETEIEESANQIADSVTGGTVIGTVNRVTSTLISFITVLIMTFMMLVEGPSIIQKLWLFTDQKKLKHRKKLLKDMYEVVTGYINGQLLITTISASVALMVMALLKVPNALAMAGIVGLFGLIPMFGATIAASIVVLSTLLVNLKLAVIMAVFFLIYQQVENATIQPYVQSRKLDLSALMIFIAALIGVNLGGILGAFIAIPVAGCVKILADDFIEKKQLRRTHTS